MSQETQPERQVRPDFRARPVRPQLQVRHPLRRTRRLLLRPRHKLRHPPVRFSRLQ